MKRTPFWPAILSLSWMCGACIPDLGAPASLLDSPRVLSVIGEPAEVAPGEPANFFAVIATPAGTAQLPRAEWSFCLQPKPISENNVVATACLADSGPPLSATNETVAAAVPQDACSRFGPDTPATEPGVPPLRPRDADVTGGYYQPIRILVARDGLAGMDMAETPAPLVAFGLQRIVCNLPNAPLAVVRAFRQQYRVNQNPILVDVVGTLGASALPLLREGAPPQADRLSSVPVDADVTMSARWDHRSAETYILYDNVVQGIVERREALRVSWFATAGSFTQARTGRSETEPETSAENVWHAPSDPGTVYVWVILRDSRGGSDFASFSITVVK